MAGGEALPLQEMGLYPLNDGEVHQCVMYLCNLAFSDVLDPCKNTKFPGGLAVSLSRELLPRLQGHPAHHTPYEPTALLSWVSPVERVIPPMAWSSDDVDPHGVKRRTLNTGPTAIPAGGCEALQLDFGSALGFFEILPVLCLCPSQLDFGGPENLFLIM